MRRAIRITIGVVGGIIIAAIVLGIFAVLTSPRSGEPALALVAWGILLAVVGAIIGALIGAKRRSKDRND